MTSRSRLQVLSKVLLMLGLPSVTLAGYSRSTLMKSFGRWQVIRDTLVEGVDSIAISTSNVQWQGEAYLLWGLCSIAVFVCLCFAAVYADNRMFRGR